MKIKYINNFLFLILHCFANYSYSMEETENSKENLCLETIETSVSSLVEQCAKKIADRLADDLKAQRDYTQWLAVDRIADVLQVHILKSLCKYHSDILWQYLSDSILVNRVGKCFDYKIYDHLVKINENGNYIISTINNTSTSKNDIKIWNTEKNESLFEDSDGNAIINHITQSINGKFLLMIFNFKNVAITDFENFNNVFEEQDDDEFLELIAVNPDNKFFVTANRNRQTEKVKIKRWDIKTGQSNYIFETNEDDIRSIQINNKWLLIRKKESNLYNLEGGKSKFNLLKSVCYTIDTFEKIMAYSYNFDMGSERLSSFYLANGYNKFIEGAVERYEFNSLITCQTIGFQNNFAALGFENGTCEIINIGDRRHFTISAQKKSIKSIALSSDEKILVTCAKDNFIKIYSTKTGECLSSFVTSWDSRFPMSPALSVAISFDNTTIAAGLRDGTIKIWKIDLTKKLEHVLEEIKRNIKKQNK